ncbi:hypothetical protein CFC21_106335 [Triticum aestivum]|nr:putative disease resistance protein RGA4 [Triticum aestivum]KAF7105537.1 hypothetical protein CFC21_106335 [Triticum aestivum]
MGDETLLERILNGDEEPKDLPLGLLQSITNDFSEERKIGQGGFGAVYKGVLRNGIIVAVKRIYVTAHTIDDKLFRREFNSLRKINHQNVVRFLGFCSNTYQTPIQEAGSEEINLANVRERLLCFEYISNGSLDKHITDELRGLEWETRYEIIIGICKGLRYLHEETSIVHMDLKPENILLDGTYLIPKFTDFGLSRPNKNTHTMGLRFGTRGYIAPEYENSGKASVKSDIYSLGAIIFELVTGCMGIPDENNVLRRWRHRWTKPPTLLQYQQVTRCLNIAVRCREQNPEARPSILKIISFLSESGSTDMHTSQIRPCYIEDDMLGIKPLELLVPFELKKISCFTIELINDTHSCIAFNIKPSNPPWYRAQPDKGIVRQQCKYGVKITVPPQDMHHADKFIVKSMKVSEGLTDEDIIEHTFEEAGKIADEVNLMVVYEPHENSKSREETNKPVEEVPKVERRKIDVSASGKSKLGNGGNAEAASMAIKSRVQGQCIKQREQRRFYPRQSSSHHSLGYMLIPLLDRVAVKAGDAQVAKLLRACGLGKARQKLECHLADIQCILLDADTKSRTNAAVHSWMEDLKTVAYQTDDILDDFRYEALRRHAAKIGHVSTAHKVLSYTTSNNPVILRHSMSKKMKDTVDMIDELVEKMNSFHFRQHTEAPRIDHLQTHSQVDKSQIVGRQDEKEQLVKILLGHCYNKNNSNHVMVLPIIGMGGIGKTTLAQLVHNDQRVKHHFELVLWACISEKFVIEEIVRSVIEVATMKKCDLTQMEALQKELCGVLGKKRYLLVLDDVWNEDGHKWDAMRSLLNSHAGSGSAIIVTSRSDQVASIMGTLPPHHISLLNEDQSWELFHRNAFGREAEKQDELITVAKKIVHKCKGLPLAIKTIAALLRSKHHSQWFSVLDSDVWKDDILTSAIVPALQLSYDHLSSEAKICFSFCALFPKDSPMDKDTLIQLWIANDFIASETRGQEIFDILVWRCFLQDVENQHYTKIGDYEHIHRSIICRMHDLMHDLAESVSGNDCFILQESSSCQEILHGPTNIGSLQHEVQYLSLDHVSNNTLAAMKEMLAPRARTILCVQRELQWTQASLDKGKSLIMALSKFMSLRALRTLSFETQMANLKHLRYLDLSYSGIATLPGSTTMLYNLQTLKLIGCEDLKKLPEGMRYMSSLRHIFLAGCPNLDCMPQGVGQLNSLQTLTNYIIDSDAGRGIDQLKDLNLGGSLSLTQLRKVHSAENAKQGNISAKHNLKRISLSWYGLCSRAGYEVDTNAEGILEALCPHNGLEVLQLSNYSGAKLSSWMHKSTLLEHLRELHLRSCRKCKDLPPLWQLPSLWYLNLDNLDSVTSMCVGNDDTDNGESCIPPSPIFPKLRVMIVYKMPKLERWHQVARQVSAVSFPRLKVLHISGCPSLETLPEGLLQQVSALTELDMRYCDKLKGAFSRGGAYWKLVEAIPMRTVF